MTEIYQNLEWNFTVELKKNWTRVFGLTSILYSFNSFENEMNYSLRSTLVVINFKLRYTCHERFCKDQFEVG